MKAPFKNYLILAILITCLSCENDSENDLVDIVEPVNEVTYTANVKAIMDNSCNSCHSNPPINGAPMSLLTFDDVKNASESRGLLARMINASAPMPPSGLLPTTTTDIIKQWEDDGLLEGE